jgi:hypothetical protein
VTSASRYRAVSSGAAEAAAAVVAAAAGTSRGMGRDDEAAAAEGSQEVVCLGTTYPTSAAGSSHAGAGLLGPVAVVDSLHGGGFASAPFTSSCASSSASIGQRAASRSGRVGSVASAPRQHVQPLDLSAASEGSLACGGPATAASHVHSKHAIAAAQQALPSQLQLRPSVGVGGAAAAAALGPAAARRQVFSPPSSRRTASLSPQQLAADGAAGAPRPAAGLPSVDRIAAAGDGNDEIGGDVTAPGIAAPAAAAHPAAAAAGPISLAGTSRILDSRMAAAPSAVHSGASSAAHAVAVRGPAATVGVSAARLRDGPAARPQPTAAPASKPAGGLSAPSLGVPPRAPYSSTPAAPAPAASRPGSSRYVFGGASGMGLGGGLGLGSASGSTGLFGSGGGYVATAGVIGSSGSSASTLRPGFGALSNRVGGATSAATGFAARPAGHTAQIRSTGGPGLGVGAGGSSIRNMLGTAALGGGSRGGGGLGLMAPTLGRPAPAAAGSSRGVAIASGNAYAAASGAPSFGAGSTLSAVLGRSAAAGGRGALNFGGVGGRPSSVLRELRDAIDAEDVDD